mgnify:CR=1 FL=1
MSGTQRAEVERQVRSLFSESNALRAMPPARQQEILRNTAEIVEALVQQRLGPAPGADPYAVGQNTAPTLPGLSPPGAPGSSSEGPGGRTDLSQFTGGARDRPEDTLAPTKAGDFGTGIATGVGQAGALLRQVNFTAFVGELIQGVFRAVVDASVQQMEAYAELVKSVTMSISEFRDQNVTENQARDHLANRYPNLMQISLQQGSPRLQVRPDADTDNLPDLATDLGLSEPISSLDDETLEEKLVPAARDEIARGRQQLLATMVMMGINRIVVTNGRINAKLNFNFQASDAMTTSATNYDVKNFGTTTVVQKAGDVREDGEYTSDYSKGADGAVTRTSNRGAGRWTQGDYQRVSSPMIQITGITQSNTEASLAASAQLAGSVDLNFKSETVDLNQLVSQNDIFRISEARGAGRAAPGSAPVQASTPSST